MAAGGSVPIRESVGEALRFVRENIRFVAIVAAAGAVAMTIISAFAMMSPAMVIPTGLTSTFAQACTYAAFVAAALVGTESVRSRWIADGGRVWAAMALISLLLLIVMFIASMIVSIVLASGPLVPYLDDLQSAGSDNAAVMAVLTRFVEQNPMTVLIVSLFFAVIWFLLTSRLYLAAPATVDQGRILTFETWSWTKGAMLRITAARLLLLVPANILSGALGHLVGRAFGMNTLDPVSAGAVAATNPAGYLIYILIAAFISFLLFSSLEAGLSTYLYRGLKPADSAPAL
jgi:hypothetical protein